MTLDELLACEAIRATMAKCAQAGDSLRGEDYAACFTEDGVLESDHSDGAAGFRHGSRAEILAWQTAWRSAAPTHQTPRSARFVRHNLTSAKIELTGADTASARTYFVVMTDIGPDHCGVYRDVFRRVGEDWLIAHRRVRTEWWAPGSHFTPAEIKPA